MCVVVFLSQAVVSEECVPVDQFVEHLLPSLLSLASDPVPNVRVLLAKALRRTLLQTGVCRTSLSPPCVNTQPPRHQQSPITRTPACQ
jgi:serine/threonine-protein phosphatase 4 regulatory subunit 1